MPVEIIRPSQHFDTVEVNMCFDYADMLGGGFVFNLSLTGEPIREKNGMIPMYRAPWDLPEDLEPWGEFVPSTNLETLAQCLNGSVNGQTVLPARVEVYERTHSEPALGRCYCGGTVELAGEYNECDRDCGREFARAGWEYAPREQWGEEIAYGMEDEAWDTERTEAGMEPLEIR